MNVELVEMPSVKEKAIGCGVNAFVSCSEVSRKMQLDRLVEAKGTNASAMLTFCPKCLIHYNCMLAMEKRPAELENVRYQGEGLQQFHRRELEGELVDGKFR